MMAPPIETIAVFHEKHITGHPFSYIVLTSKEIPKIIPKSEDSFREEV